MKKNLIIAAATALVLFFASCQKLPPWNNPPVGHTPETKDAQVAYDWYALQLRILLERNTTLNGAYFGYMGVALYEAVRSGDKNAVSLSKSLYQMPVMPFIENGKTYNWPACANTAMASMLRSYNTGLTNANLASIDSLEQAYNQQFQAASGTEIFNRSQAYGKSVAMVVYNWSLSDNFNASNTGYMPPVFVGAWVPTPPAFANGVMPYVGTARPFLSTNIDVIAPAGPAPYNEEVGSDFYKIAKKVYDVSQNLTAEQKNIALFWVDQGNGIGYTPAGHDMAITTEILKQKQANLFVAAETYAKAGISEREASILCFKAKYKYSVVRPVTYINRVINAGWVPFIVTPPHPEYPAAHAYVTGSVMETVAAVVGNNINFTDHTYDFRGWSPRSFNTVFEAGEEAGMSRLYGGIHYLESINAGLKLGKDLGDQVGKIKLHTN